MQACISPRLSTRRIYHVVRSAIVALALPCTVMASDAFPTKPINMVVSYPAGGSVDVAARIYQDQLTKQLGQPIVIENKGGAGGTIATNAVARAQPDGYTLLMTLSSHTINPAIYSSLSFDTEADFKPVSLVASAPQVLVAHPSFAPSTLQELIDHVKKSDVAIPYGTAGTGSPSHIAGELFKQMGGDLKLLHVPYRGGGPATIDVVSGQIPLLWVSLPSVTSFIKSGKLKALAVSTEKRTPVMPDIPSAAETLPGFNVDSWYAVFAPANTPDAVVDRLYNAISQASKDPSVQTALMAQGAVAVGSTPVELGNVVTREIAMWKELAKKAQIKVD